MKGFCSIEAAIEEIKNGRIVIVVDDEERENEGDMIFAAEKITPGHINFLAKYARGLICLALTSRRSRELDLQPMVSNNTSKLGTSFTVSIDAVQGTTTGISAFDRTATIKKVLDPAASVDDFAKPGHIFPLCASEGGVLKRAGHTEAAADFARLSGLQPAGVLCEIMDEDGHMARLPKLMKIADKHGLKIVTIKDLIEYRRRTEKLISQAEKTSLPTEFGEFGLFLYKSELDGAKHIALVKGNISSSEAVLVRVHSQCLTGDVFGSMRCDCGKQLRKSLQLISREKMGVFLYMQQEGRGIGIENKIKAYALQDQGQDTVEANKTLGFPADLRDYGIGAQILVDLGVRKIKLLTNNPKKIIGLGAFGLEIVERVPIEILPNDINRRYLFTKKNKLGHLLNGIEEPRLKREAGKE